MSNADYVFTGGLISAVSVLLLFVVGMLPSQEGPEGSSPQPCVEEPSAARKAPLLKAQEQAQRQAQGQHAAAVCDPWEVEEGIYFEHPEHGLTYMEILTVSFATLEDAIEAERFLLQKGRETASEEPQAHAVSITWSRCYK